MDNSITKVIFRKWPNGQLIALFPELPGDMNPNHCQSYMHLGQHGAASVNITHHRVTYFAYPYEYQALKKELECMGYKLKVIQRFSPKHTKLRKEELAKTKAYRYPKLPLTTS